MLPRIWLKQGHPVELSGWQPAGTARLRLFGLLAVLGPLFAGLNYLVLEAAPRIETQVLVSDVGSSTPEVVVVERVVERPIYVPVDRLPAVPLVEPAATTVNQSAGAEVRAGALEVATGRDLATAAAADESKPEASDSPEVVSSQPEPETSAGATSVQQAVPPVWVAPAVRIAPMAPVVAVEQVADEETTPEESSDEMAAAESAEPVAEPDGDGPVADATEVIVVHTLMWDGEQFVATGDGAGDQLVPVGERDAVGPPAADEPADGVDASAEAAGPEVADAGDGESEPADVSDEGVVAAGDDEMAPEEVAADSVEQDASLVGDEAEQVAEGGAPEEEQAATEVDESESVAALEEGEQVAGAQESESAAGPEEGEPVAVTEEREPEPAASEDASVPEASPTMSRRTVGTTSVIVLPSD